MPRSIAHLKDGSIDHFKMEKNKLYPTSGTLTPFFQADQYKKAMDGGKLSMPETFKPEERDEKYWLNVCQYVYGSFSANRTFIGNGGRLGSGRTIYELRSYARGLQDITKYKRLNDHRTDEGARNELDQISWENTMMFNSMRAQALSRIGSIRYKPGVRCVDDIATEKRLDAYLTDKLATDPRTQQVVAAAGLSPGTSSPIMAGMSPTDVDVFNNLGGYTLVQEILMADAIQASLGLSGWDDTLAPMLDQDLFDTGICACMVHRNPNDNKYLVRYTDLAGLIIPISNYNDFRDSSYRAIVERCTLSSLRIQADLDEETLYRAAKTYSGQMGNPMINENDGAWQSSSRQSFSALRTSRYDDFALNVMTVYLVALDVEKYICGFHRNGNLMYDRVRSDYELTARDINRGKTLEANPVQYLYKCRWVVGTDIVFDFGKDDTIVRAGNPGNKSVVWPLQVYALNEPSMVERCIPVIDDLENAVRKKRLSLASLPPGPSYSIDMSLMEDSVVIAGKTYNVLDMLGIYFNTGFFYHRSIGEFMANNETGSQRSPIVQMPSQKLGELQAFILEATNLIQSLQMTLGLNEVATGTAETNKLLNGVANEMQKAATSAMKPLIDARTDLFLGVERVIGLKYQVGVLFGDIDIRYVPGSRSIPKVVRLDKGIVDSEFYFTVESMPSQEDKDALIMMLNKLAQERRVDESVFFAVMNMIQEGDIVKAQYYLSVQAGKAAERERSMQKENIQLQAQANAQSATQAEQARAQAEVAIVNAKKELASVESELRMKEDAAKHTYRLQELTMGKAADAHIAAQQGAVQSAT